MSFTVAQLGARMHYAIPRILHQNGVLDHFFTDICASKGWPRLLKAIPSAIRPNRLQRLLTRDPKDIPSGKITAFTEFGVQYARKLASARTGEDRDAAFLWAGEEFGNLVTKRGFGNASGIYAYNTASTEIFQDAGKRGLMKVMEQTISPRQIEIELMDEEMQNFPGWEVLGSSKLAIHLCEREKEEWEAADVILCASEYVKQGIISCGGKVEKCKVVPYGIDRHQIPARNKERRPGPLRVLTVGAVGLRKGSPYLLGTAKLMGEKAQIRLIGAHHVLPDIVSEMSRYLEIPGAVPRSEISDHYAWADVYVLPSLCEGSATSTYEAMFHGLPVICTPHTGSVVRDGVDGYIVPARSPEVIAEKLETFLANPSLLETMSASALKRASEFTLENYSINLLRSLNKSHIIYPSAG